MKKITLKYAIVFTALACTAGMANAQVNQIGAVADMIDLYTTSVKAKGNVANSAASGDVASMTEYSKRSDAVDASVATGQNSFQAMNQAAQNGNMDQAAAAQQSLGQALQAAKNALNGVVPTQDSVEQWKASLTNTGGGPGKAGDTPNIYKKPTQSAAESAVLNSLSGNLGAATGGNSGGMSGMLSSGGSDIGDSDATEI